MTSLGALMSFIMVGGAVWIVAILVFDLVWLRRDLVDEEYEYE